MIKILILANNDVGLYKFRKELVQELINKNYEVFISLPYGDYVPELQKIGCKFIDTSVDRRGTNPSRDIRLLWFYIKTILNINPDVVLTYTVKPNIYGGVACRVLNKPLIANITGLGTAIENKGIIQKIVLTLYKFAIKKATCAFFQNSPNQKLFIEKNIVNENTRLIPGSGVNLDEHCLEEYPENDDIIKFLFIGRIMRDKGISELLEAAIQIKKIYSNVEFKIIGECEENYLPKLKELERSGIIRYLGRQNDIHFFIKNSHATILPSYHEGTANVLLETASTGRPIIATDVTGCCETYTEGVSGFGCRAKNVDSLKEAIEKFIKLSNNEKKAMGLAGRKKVENEFDRKVVIKAYIAEIINAINKHTSKQTAKWGKVL